jgi:hypothetical protein
MLPPPLASLSPHDLQDRGSSILDTRPGLRGEAQRDFAFRAGRAALREDYHRCATGWRSHGGGEPDGAL